MSSDRRPPFVVRHFGMLAWALGFLAVACVGTGLYLDSQAAERERWIGEPGAIDLLPRIDLTRDSIVGTWGLQGGVLISPEVPEGRLQLRHRVPQEYDLILLVERRSEEFRSFHLGLPVGGRQVLVTLDGFGPEPRSALEFLDGKVSSEPGSVHDEPLFALRETRRVVCSVRRGRLRVAVGATRVIDWEGDFGRLGLPEHWSVPEPGSAFVGTWKSRFAVRQISLVPLPPLPAPSTKK